MESIKVLYQLIQALFRSQLLENYSQHQRVACCFFGGFLKIFVPCILSVLVSNPTDYYDRCLCAKTAPMDNSHN
ncbi:hypothetical protein QUB05_28990 [Microcoleus sp. F10-C6]|uniref:hypothetical protein n=1 Tax=unclassified Microcoleus TaxID=2642155 RepID=UPI002FCFDA45